MTTIQFQQWQCTLKVLHYNHGGTALVLHGAPGTEYASEKIAVASVYVGDLPEGYVAIKDYAENEGMLAALIAAGVVSAPVNYHRSGFVSIPVCQLLLN